jgi:hypothetical protein
MTVFINVEPSTLLTACPEDLRSQLWRAENRLRAVMEMSEEALLARPDVVLEASRAARDIGWGVAIDDAGADERALALFPLANPDVVKLDMTELRADQASLIARGDAARLYGEQSGASVLVQGVEQPDDVLLARSLIGAGFGQGWHFGPPEALPSKVAFPRHVVPFVPARTAAGTTPFEVLADARPSTYTQKRFIEPISAYLQWKAVSRQAQSLVLISFQRDREISADDLELLTEVARRTAFSAATGPRLAEGSRPVPWSVPDAADPIGSQWNVLVLSQDYAAALCARDLGDTAEDQFRGFEYVLTHDRELVLQAVQAFLTRLGQAALEETPT